MPVEGVALIPRCAECEAYWLPADEEFWSAYWVDDGPEEKLIFYCRRALRGSSRTRETQMLALPPNVIVELPVDQLGLAVLKDMVASETWNSRSYILKLSSGADFRRANLRRLWLKPSLRSMPAG